ncbi:MAG: tripeptide aminopeptidase [Acidobacteriota bacterium]|jgi:tripeptide aminopeptidase|nr:tripeptide aminopeptidase [Acidobacteriota bacterium]
MKRYFIITALILFTSTIYAQTNPPTESVLDRFLRYAKIDTQSKEDQDKVPSTDKQKVLANLLAKELRALGAKDVRVSEFAIVYAMVPGNLPDNSKVPVIGFMAHMDTSPEVSGENVNPTIHKNYRGGDITLPKDPTQIITLAKNPDLKNLIGDDIITADGTTLLGSDDKAGCAEIMTMIDILKQNPQIKHGGLAIAFTPDEEVGGGIDKFDVKGYGAKFAYTVDGEELGEIANETWSARTATVHFQGKNTHPGTAKGIMINSAYAAADFMTRFPPNMLPETTEGRVGFVHPYTGTLDAEESSIKILLRDFELSGLNAKEQLIRRLARMTGLKFPKVKIRVDVKENYKNMKEVLKDFPQLTDYAMEASRRAGLTPHIRAIRGGTDGANLTFRGLPTPNLFTGGHNFHGKLEFNSVKGLEKSTETLVNLVQVFAERGM